MLGSGIERRQAWAAPWMVANMSRNTATGRGVGTDQIWNVENLIGSAFKNTVPGDFNGNRIERRGGAFGNDTLTGGLGADSFACAEPLGTANLNRTAPGPFDPLDLGTLTATAFRSGAAATTTARHIL